MPNLNPSRTMSSTDTVAVLRHDDSSAAEPARRRLASKKSFIQTLHLSPKLVHIRSARKNVVNNSSSASLSANNHLHLTDTNTDTDDLSRQLVEIHDMELYVNQLDKGYEKDVYRWAVLYENQRG